MLSSPNNGVWNRFCAMRRKTTAIAARRALPPTQHLRLHSDVHFVLEKYYDSGIDPNEDEQRLLRSYLSDRVNILLDTKIDLYKQYSCMVIIEKNRNAGILLEYDTPDSCRCCRRDPCEYCSMMWDDENFYCEKFMSDKSREDRMMADPVHNVLRCVFHKARDLQLEFVVPNMQHVYFHYVHEAVLRSKNDTLRARDDIDSGSGVHYFGDNSRLDISEQHTRDNNAMFDEEIGCGVELDYVDVDVANSERECDGYFLRRAGVEPPRKANEIAVIIAERELRRIELLESLGFSEIRSLLVNKQLHRNGYYEVASLRMSQETKNSVAFKNFVFVGDEEHYPSRIGGATEANVDEEKIIGPLEPERYLICVTLLCNVLINIVFM